MNRAEFRDRTKKYALRVLQLFEGLPRTRACDVIGKQLLRAAMSVGANYRAAGRARSTAEFLAKMGIVEEESDECAYWLEILIEGKIIRPARLMNLLNETNEIVSLTVASIRTARRRRS